MGDPKLSVGPGSCSLKVNMHASTGVLRTGPPALLARQPRRRLHALGRSGRLSPDRQRPQKARPGSECRTAFETRFLPHTDLGLRVPDPVLFILVVKSPSDGVFSSIHNHLRVNCSV